MSKPSITNCPNTFFIIVHSFSCWLSIESRGTVVLYCQIQFACVQIRHTPLSGGYCGEVPPLPIPNREVKPTCADGTAMQCGRVGSRLLLSKPQISKDFWGFFCFHADWFFVTQMVFGSRRFRRWRRFFLCCFSLLLFLFSHRFYRCAQILDLFGLEFRRFLLSLQHE